MIYKLCALVITACVVAVTVGAWWHFANPPEEPVGYLSGCYEPGSIAVVPIHGDILWGGDISGGGVVYGYEVTGVLEELEYWGDFAGVIFDIDSAGGLPVASYRIADAISSLGVPSAAVIGDMGLSGGYAVAAATDRIFVNPVSDVGSIGVTASYVSEHEANEFSGFQYESLSSGDYKDVGDPARPLSDEEREFLQANIDNAHDHFVQLVADNRQMSLSEVAAVADGKWYSGEEAIQRKLADATGDIEEAVAYLRSLSGEESPVCYATLY